MLAEVGSSSLGQLVDSLAIDLARADLPQILQHLQRRVNRARAGRVGNLRTLLDLADDLVAVLGPIFEDAQDQELDVTPIDPPSRPTAPRPEAHPFAPGFVRRRAKCAKGPEAPAEATVAVLGKHVSKHAEY